MILILSAAFTAFGLRTVDLNPDDLGLGMFCVVVGWFLFSLHSALELPKDPDA